MALHRSAQTQEFQRRRVQIMRKAAYLSDNYVQLLGELLQVCGPVFP